MFWKGREATVGQRTVNHEALDWLIRFFLKLKIQMVWKRPPGNTHITNRKGIIGYARRLPKDFGSSPELDGVENHPCPHGGGPIGHGSRQQVQVAGYLDLLT